LNSIITSGIKELEADHNRMKPGRLAVLGAFWDIGP
jgi:hypothetical protein